MNDYDQRRRRQHRNISPLTLMLLAQIYQQLERLPVKPPVTIALLAMNIWPHLVQTNFFQFNLADMSQNCLNPRIIVESLREGYGLKINRLLLSGFIHADDHHLYYNMLSLCWKGINLESRMGSTAFLQLVIFSLVISHSIAVLLAYILCFFFDYDASYRTCAVGFSAVLFSLKYVWNQHAEPTTNVWGINVPTKYAAWAELVLCSLVTPNVSFLGHLAGILAGMIYVHGSQFIRASRWSDYLTHLFGETPANHGGRTRYTYARGTTGAAAAAPAAGSGSGAVGRGSSADRPYPSTQSSSSSSSGYSFGGGSGTYNNNSSSSSGSGSSGFFGSRNIASASRNTPILQDEDEEYYIIDDIDEGSSSAADTAAPDVDEIRRRRLQRFQNR